MLKRLGRGAMGVVHLAYDPELDRRVAIKLLRDAGDDELSKELLRREAQAMARLSHPNVVAVYEVAEFEGTLFVAMEYVQGVTLRAWLRDEPRSEREIVGVLAQAGRGLAAAHAAGLLHRDFKPDNVVVDEEGRARVLDFGLARAVTDQPTPSAAHSTPAIGDVEQTLPMPAGDLTEETRSVVAGTPAYMGPELLFEGRGDERSDQYAFCTTLFEALGGARPYDRQTQRETAAAKRSGRIAVPPRPIRPKLRAILARGLHPDPEQRWPRMTALVDALEGAMRRMPPLAVGAIAVGAVAVATLGWMAMRARGPQMCTGLDRELAGVWDAPARDGVTRGIGASGGKNARATVAHVVPALDAYAAAWTAMSKDACEDARVRGTQSIEVLDLRTACLDQRARELHAAARVLASADRTVADRATKVIEGLSPVEDCADLAALREPAAAPRDPAKRASIERVRDLVAQAKTLYSSGRFEEAHPIASQAAAEAKLVGAAALEAEALHWRAMVAFYREGGAKAAAKEMLDAAIASEAARHDAFAAESWTWLTHFIGYVLERPADAEPYARLAEAAIQRRGGDPLATAHLLKVRANVLYGDGKRDDALVLYRQNIAILDQTLGPSDPRSALARLDIGDDYYDHGQRAEALATYKSVADVLVSAYGESNPSTQLILQRVAACEVSLALPTALEAAERAHDAVTYDDPDVENDLGQALVLAGRSDDGIAHLRHALELAPAVLDGKQVLTFRVDLARALLRAGRTDEAGAELARVPRRADAGSTAEDSSEVLAVRALYDVALGHATDALADATKARAIEHAEHIDDANEAALADLALGEAKLALHAPDEAIAPLDHALAIAEKGFDPVFVNQMRDARARAAMHPK